LNKRQTSEDITTLFKDKKDCNIAIITGRVSKIIAFDIDGKEAGVYFDQVIESLDERIKNAIRNTMQTKTGSSEGKHIIIGFNPEEFQSDEEIKTSTLWIGKENHSEIKIKSEGSYIIAPTSLHASGNRYQFLNKVKPIILSKEQIHKIIAAFRSKQNERITITKYGDDNDNDDGKKKVNGIYKILTNLQIEKVGSILKEYYKEGNRDEIIFGIAGLLFKNKIALTSAQELIASLTDSTNDLEKSSRLKVLEDTYLKGLNGQNVIGSTHILEVLTKIVNGDQDLATKIVRNILQILSNEEEKSDVDKGTDTPSTTQILIQLARENTPLLFKDQYDNPYAKIRISNHIEIISLGSRKSEYYLSKLYYDYTHGKVASQDAINNAIRVLTAQALFDGPIEILHLRVA
jgi:bifunctional DNA primase/polymerase-like protein